MKVFYDPGRYVVRITGQALGYTPKKNAQLVLKFMVIGRVTNPGSNEYEVLKVQLERRFFRVINENTGEFALEDLRVLGFTGKSFSQLDPASRDHISFEGMEIEMFCDRSNDQSGEPREDWSIARSTPLVQEAVPPEKLRELDYMFQKQLQSLATSRKEAKPQQAAAPQTAAKRTQQQAKPQPVAAGKYEASDEDVQL